MVAEPASAPAPLGAPLTTTHRAIGYPYPSTSLRTGDSLYRLTDADYSTGEFYQYAYDPVGNRLSLTTTAGVVNYQYDDANRMVMAGDVSVGWDDNGNMTSFGSRTYEYDHANRLTQVVSGTLTTEFTYDSYVPNHIKRANELLGIGNRVRTVVDGQATDYVLDVASPLPQVLLATTGGQRSYYLHGMDGSAGLTTSLIGQHDSGTWAYHLPDALGSVRSLTDPVGQVVSSYSFSPFGVPTGESGGDPYGFTGEWWERRTELLYLRARMYQPGVGRFISSDPWPGDPLRPLSLNGWVYVTNNPTNVADPTGLREWRKSSSRFERIAERVYATSRPDINFIHLEPSIPVPWSSFARPDVLNSWTGDVYEVEPLHLLPAAFAEAIYYRDLLTSAGGGGYNFWGQPVTGYGLLPRSDPNDWNLTTWQLGLPFPPIRKPPPLIITAYGPEPIPWGFDFVVMSPGGGAMVWWLEPRPETIAAVCFGLAGVITLADMLENAVTGGVGLVDEPIVILFVGTLIVIGKNNLQVANAPVTVN